MSAKLQRYASYYNSRMTFTGICTYAPNDLTERESEKKKTRSEFKNIHEEITWSSKITPLLSNLVISRRKQLPLIESIVAPCKLAESP